MSPFTLEISVGGCACLAKEVIYEKKIPTLEGEMEDCSAYVVCENESRIFTTLLGLSRVRLCICGRYRMISVGDGIMLQEI